MPFQWIKISELKPHPKNPNVHSKEQIKRLIKLIRAYGWRHPIIVSNQTGYIIVGHGRLEAAIEMGLQEVPIHYQDFKDEQEEYAFMVADNAIASWAELDLAAINLEVPDLGPDFDIELLGIKDFEIEVADREDQDEVPEVPKETYVKLGDLFILGSNRLLCGDATDLASVERLMNGENADICFTSPPYNLGENAKLRGYNGNGDDSAYLSKSDHKTTDEYLKFLSDFTSIALNVSKTVFVNIQLLAGNKFVLPKFWNQFTDHLIDLIIWDKEHAAPQLAARVLNSVFEMIFIFSSEKFPTRSMKSGPEFRGTLSNIFRLNPLRGPNDESAKDHGAVFPVKFAQYFLETFSDGSVYEPFAGSGSTMIASEKLKRSCFAMEIDPQYCQVIIERWEKFTGQKAVKVESEPPQKIKKKR